MYATAVGLVLNSLEQKEKFSGTHALEKEEKIDEGAVANDIATETEVVEKKPKETKRFFDKWAEKFKEFLDNAE